MEQVVFKLNKNEASAVVQVVGQLPTSSNAWVLYNKLLAQFNEQTQEQQDESEPETEVQEENK